MSAVFARVLVVVVLAATAFTPMVASPAAWACGCGAYSPREGGEATVPQETALVVAPGDGTEEVYLSLSVDSNVASGALLFPVPDKHATVTAGPTHLFGQLAQLTESAETHAPGGDGNGAPQAPAPVTVENRQQIGPLDVVTLSSGDSAALSTWLTEHGFAAKPALAQAARPYTDAGWAFVAVRLRPGEEGKHLDGTLDPLKISFATDEIVYPMRLSAMADEPEQVTVYTLADRQLALRTTTTGMRTSWAGEIGELADSPDVATAAHGLRFLTRFEGTLQPAEITGDFTFVADTESPSTSSAGASGQGTSGRPAGEIVVAALAGLVLLTVLFLTVRVGRRNAR